jgi:peptidoglycan hydrolase-like protein with peptidoglycan-binding domain
MPLKSRIFRGDPKLEGAASSASSHIKQGAAGEHVKKIQYALARIEEEPLDLDGKFGPATASVVLAYKKKRQIINRSYQSQADDIVGVMTIAALDEEMCKLEEYAGPTHVIQCSCRITR